MKSAGRKPGAMAGNQPHETVIPLDTSVFPAGRRVSAFKRITVLLAENHAVVARVCAGCWKLVTISK